MNWKKIVVAGLVAGMVAVTGCAGNVPENNVGNRNGARLVNNMNRTMDGNARSRNRYNANSYKNRNVNRHTAVNSPKAATRSHAIGQPIAPSAAHNSGAARTAQRPVTRGTGAYNSDALNKISQNYRNGTASRGSYSTSHLRQGNSAVGQASANRVAAAQGANHGVGHVQNTAAKSNIAQRSTRTQGHTRNAAAANRKHAVTKNTTQRKAATHKAAVRSNAAAHKTATRSNAAAHKAATRSNAATHKTATRSNAAHKSTQPAANFGLGTNVLTHNATMNSSLDTLQNTNIGMTNTVTTPRNNTGITRSTGLRTQMNGSLYNGGFNRNAGLGTSLYNNVNPNGFNNVSGLNNRVPGGFNNSPSYGAGQGFNNNFRGGMNNTFRNTTGNTTGINNRGLTNTAARGNMTTPFGLTGTGSLGNTGQTVMASSQNQKKATTNKTRSTTAKKGKKVITNSKSSKYTGYKTKSSTKANKMKVVDIDAIITALEKLRDNDSKNVTRSRSNSTTKRHNRQNPEQMRRRNAEERNQNQEFLYMQPDIGSSKRYHQSYYRSIAAPGTVNQNTTGIATQGTTGITTQGTTGIVNQGTTDITANQATVNTDTVNSTGVSNRTRHHSSHRRLDNQTPGTARSTRTRTHHRGVQNTNNNNNNTIIHQNAMQNLSK